MFFCFVLFCFVFLFVFLLQLCVVTLICKNNIFQVGIREHKHVAMTLKEHYLDWAFLQGGLKTVRRVYSMMNKEKPLSLEFFRKYITLENTQVSVLGRMSQDRQELTGILLVHWQSSTNEINEEL